MLRGISICVLWSIGLAACSFDRSPRSRDSELSGAMRLWSSDLGEEDNTRTSRSGRTDRDDAGTKAGTKAQTGSKSQGKSDQKSSKPSDENLVANADEDAGERNEERPPEPLRCKDQFCPLADAPVTACCTTQTDYQEFRTRAPDACGIQLSGVDEAQYGSGCWERDQLGIIDPRCPARGSEPGCCATDGLCGTSDPERHLGCYHAKGVDVRHCRLETEPVGTVCDPRGNYALRVSVDAAWNGRPGGLAALTDDGRGTIQIYLLVRVEDVDAATGELKTAARVCGVSLPQFYSSTLCESYQAVFPDGIWESPNLPPLYVSGRYECAADGCMMSIWPSTYTFGIRLDNPEAPWPTPQETPYLRCPDLPDENCFVDDDADGKPGISIGVLTEGEAPVLGACRMYPYRGAPLNDSIAAIFGGVRRSDRMQVGIRARVGGSVRFGDDCVTASGSAVVDYVNSRAHGCYVQPGTYDALGGGPAGADEPCRREEANFIDLSMPVYQVLGAGESPGVSRMPRDNSASAGPTVSIVRFAPELTPGCTETRQAPF